MWFASYTLKQCTRILKTFVLCMYMLHIPHNLILCVNGCHVQACDLTLKCTYLPLKSQSHKQFGGSCLCNKLLDRVACMQKEAVHVHCERRFIFAFLIEKEKKKRKRASPSMANCTALRLHISSYLAMRTDAAIFQLLGATQNILQYFHRRVGHAEKLSIALLF